MFSVVDIFYCYVLWILSVQYCGCFLLCIVDVVCCSVLWMLSVVQYCGYFVLFSIVDFFLFYSIYSYSVLEMSCLHFYLQYMC